MNKFFLIIFATFIGFNAELPSEKISSNTNKTKLLSQRDMLLGEFNWKELQQEPYSEWFTPTYEDYTPNKKALKTIKKNISDYEVTIIMGTWCHDSKRETPKMIKLLELSDYDMDRLTLIGVDYSKSTPDKEAEAYDILRVPTIIFSRDGEEVNRFVEHSRQSLEEDIAKIVAGKDYENSYAK